MKIYTIHSPSHQYFYNMFQESFNKLNSKHTLVSRVVEQISEPDFNSKDVYKFYRLMVLYILEILYTETEPFIFMGVDIYFFKDFDIDMGDNDMLVTYEKHVFGLPTICTGVTFLKPNKANRKMFLWILKYFDIFKADQTGVNAYLFLNKFKTYPFRLKWKLLPLEFYSINYNNGNMVWNGEDIKVTVDPYLFHYHWTLGNANRLKLLKMVRKQFE